MKVVASVQARLGSTRLPGKVLLHLGERRVVQWVLDRTEAAKSIDQTIAAIGDRPENEAIIEYCDREGIRSIVGPEENLLARHLAVADETDCDLLVRITADCPFVPPAEIDRVVEAHRENGARYTTNNTEAMPIGTAVDVFDIKFLMRLAEESATHPNRRPIDSPGEYDIAFSPNPEWEEYDVHTAVDTPADYWRLIDAVREAGTGPHAITEWLAASDD